MVAFRTVLSVAAVFVTTYASAQEATMICANAGVQYQVGEYACIAACHGQRRLARCDAIAQRTSWTYLSDACPSVMINPAWPTDWSEVPAVASMNPIPLVVNMSAPTPEIALRIASAFAHRDVLAVR